jgi:hypothetical protein
VQISSTFTDATLCFTINVRIRQLGFPFIATYACRGLYRYFINLHHNSARCS